MPRKPLLVRALPAADAEERHQGVIPVIPQPLASLARLQEARAVGRLRAVDYGDNRGPNS